VEKIRIAVVQQNGNPGQVETNRSKALAYADQALQGGADIILFHEELLVGYVSDVYDLAEPLYGPTTSAFQTLLQDSGSLIIYGLTERDGPDLYISAPVVSGSGVLANYRKTHLWWDAQGLRHEPTAYKPGNQMVTFDFNGTRCGLMICYDGDFPEMTRAYANLGCSVLFWMNNRNSRGHAEVTDLAYRNSMIMAVSCCCGPDEKGQFCRGGSNITGASGACLAEIWDREGMVVYDVDPDEALTLREKNPWFKGQRQDLYR
jgi:predicted amidohydrolase